MQKRVKFSIPGKAVAKGRPRKGMYGGFYTPKNTTKFENFVKMIASKYFKKPISEAVEIHVKFKLPRPKRLIWKTKPMPEVPCTNVPDIDNMLKSVVDGLEGIAFYNDKQIWKIVCEKVYHAGNDKPETIVEIIWKG